MNKKAETKTLLIVIILAVAIIGYFYFFGEVGVPSGGDLSPGQRGGIINGYYDKATGQCWIDKDSPPGMYPIGQIETTLFQCCLNQAAQQVDCNDATKTIPFAIYQGVPGIFSVTHGVKITNTGNVDITKGWIDTATWTPIHTTLTTAYSGMVGSASVQAGPILVANYRTFSSTAIDLQAIGGTGTPITYTLSLVTKGSATGLADFSKTTPATITVTKEAIGFDVVITLT